MARLQMTKATQKTLPSAFAGEASPGQVGLSGSQSSHQATGSSVPAASVMHEAGQVPGVTGDTKVTAGQSHSPQSLALASSEINPVSLPGHVSRSSLGQASIEPGGTCR